jgi:hypothetical protein
MRPMPWSVAFLTFGAWILSGYLALRGSSLLFGRLPLTDYRGLVLTLGAVFLFYVCIITCYRLLLWKYPFQTGEVAPGSPGDVAYNIHTFFQMLFFWPVIYSMLIPLPFSGFFYRALGAKMGPQSFSGGYLVDAPLIKIGNFSLIGGQAMVSAHVVEGKRLIVQPVVIGDRVTIGGRVGIMPGVVIGDGAVVAADSLVVKNTKIGPGELWSGSPARFVRKLSDGGANGHAETKGPPAAAPRCEAARQESDARAS